VTFWLIWRVWRRGQVSRWILIIFGSGFGCVNAAFHVPKHPAALILLVIYAGQLALLLSPALSGTAPPRRRQLPQIPELQSSSPCRLTRSHLAVKAVRSASWRDDDGS
jgi:hypothetical protein